MIQGWIFQVFLSGVPERTAQQGPASGASLLSATLMRLLYVASFVYLLL